MVAGLSAQTADLPPPCPSCVTWDASTNIPESEFHLLKRR
jgi:hypothetical protein